MKFKNKNFRRILFSLVGAVVIATALSFEIFNTTANRVADEIYQAHKTPNSQIVIIGMDEKAQDTYGAMPWPRDIMASAIEILSSDLENKPAVIGIDTLYTNESSTESDNKLIEAIQKAGNVVTATNITFGTELVTLDDGSFYMSDYSVLLVEEPFEGLNEVSKSGHINAMLDTDGILRHVLGSVQLKDGSFYPSFNQVIYNEYLKYKGIEDVNIPSTDSKGRWYLSFSSYPGSYSDGYSIVDLTQGNLSPELFKDKIVLIGPYALGMNDEYLTAIDHARKMFGVEYQANAIAAMLSGDLKVEILTEARNVAIFIISFFVLFYFYEKKIIKLTISWIILCALWMIICLGLWNIGYVVQIFYVLSALVICYIIAVAFNYLKASIEKNEITKAFKRYVAPQLVSKLIENESFNTQLGGKTTNIAVLFADIRGFTPLSEKLSPNEISSVLNRYLSMMSECVFKYNGTLDKFMGDCAMAFWGAPLEDDESALKAVKASLEMLIKAKDLEQEIFKKYNHKISIGIGINYGPAVVGNFGSENRMDYTAIGDTVNVASRLESNAFNNILVSGAMVKELENKVLFNKITEDIILKGKTQKVEIYEVEKVL